ncbi:TolB family protein, partial [Planctomycetota bacterium]
MKWLNDYRMRLVFVGIVAAMIIGGGIARADFTFGEPMNLGPTVNSSADDMQPTISADGLSLFFHSRRIGGLGAADLWVTYRPTVSDSWGVPVNLGDLVNSSAEDLAPSISSDGLSLFFHSNRSGGHGSLDLWVSTRSTPEGDWGNPMNLGPLVNSSVDDRTPCISADGLILYFVSNRPGGYGDTDIWITTRIAKEAEWDTPVHLASNVNSSYAERQPTISADGCTLFFVSFRPSGFGDADIWMTTRSTPEGDWEPPVNLGPTVNTPYKDHGPDISSDGRSLFFSSDRPGGSGAWDLYQTSIISIVDLNGDGFVDAFDMCVIVDHWGEDYPLCDIAPAPFGDGIVDVQ